MTQETERNLPKIGYLYHYPRLDHPTEHFRLDIHVTSEPTGLHFDVLRVLIPTKTDTETIKLLKVTHPWPYEKSAGVAPGKIIMEDRVGKKEEAFTFGGQLTISNQDEQTSCILVSSAPILEISEAAPVHMHLAEEVEMILAEMQAKYSDHKEYEQQLCKLDSLRLYSACLNTLLVKYENFPQKTERLNRLLRFLKSEKVRLQEAGLAGYPHLRIDDLFG